MATERKGMLSQTFMLIDLARSACARCEKECNAREFARSYDPLVSIVFAAATCEAFMTELSEWVRLHCDRPGGLIHGSNMPIFPDLYE